MSIIEDRLYAAQRKIADLERELAGARYVSIPTDTMLQEFSGHYRRGFTAGRTAALPPGWVMVPTEPTPEMVSAYLAANHAYWKEMDEGPAPIGKWCKGTPAEATAKSYATMIAAAPKVQS